MICPTASPNTPWCHACWVYFEEKASAKRFFVAVSFGGLLGSIAPIRSATRPVTFSVRALTFDLRALSRLKALLYFQSEERLAVQVHQDLGGQTRNASRLFSFSYRSS